jgi:large repetitive protein
VDNDSLASAEIGFRRENFIVGIDLLLFTTSPNITGKYNEQAGILTLNGKAVKAEYTKIIRSIQYNLSSTTNLKLENKSVYITLSDGKALSDTRDRTIHLEYNFNELFKELDIPSGFTPNGDAVNDTWEIYHRLGIDQFSDAEVHVYNKRGLLVFESIGFEKKWDGVYKGELLPADSYFYTIDLKFPYIQKTFKGVVTILYSKN